MVLFPSMEWTKEYVKRLNEDKEFQEAGKGWGVDFNGDWLYIIENYPFERMDYSRLPEEVLKEAVYLVGGNIYTYVKLKDGKCLEMRPLRDPYEIARTEVGFKFRGHYDQWKLLIKGEADATRLVMTGKMKLEGDMSKVIKYIKMTTRTSEISSEIPTEFIDEVYGKK